MFSVLVIRSYFCRFLIPILLLNFLGGRVYGQLVDKVLGQKRTHVQTLLKPLRIIDYKKERVVYLVQDGIHQAVLFENDTCNRFYWAVSTKMVPQFRTMLAENGYVAIPDNMYQKDSLQLYVKPLNSGKATLFVAMLSKKLTGKRDAAGQKVVKPIKVDQEPMPLLQQAILAEEKDTVTKQPKDPMRFWIGPETQRVSILGWEP